MNVKKLGPAIVRGGDYKLPQKDLVSPGSVFEDFEELATAWTVSGTGATREVNTTEFRTGTQSIKLTTGSGVTSIIQRTITGWVSGGSPPARFRLSFYCHSDAPVDDITYIRVYIGDQATLAPNAFYAAKNTAGSERQIVPGWNTWDIYPENWVMTGSEAWTTEVRLGFYVSPKTGKTVSISFDELRLNPVMRPAAMVMFMDDYGATFTNAIQNYMRPRNLRGTYFITVDEMDGVKGLTTANLLTLDSWGWSVANFGQTYIPDVAVVAQADITTNMAACKAWLDALGLTRASMHHFHMGGNYTEAYRLGLLDAGITTLSFNGYGHPSGVGDNLLATPGSVSMSQGVNNLAAILAKIDLAYSTGRIITLFVNKVLDVPGGDTYAMSTADFRAVIDYCRARKMPFLTMDDYIAMQSGPISVPK